MLPLPESSRRFWNPAAASGFQLPLPQIIRYTNLDHTTGFKYVLLKVLSGFTIRFAFGCVPLWPEIRFGLRQSSCNHKLSIYVAFFFHELH